MGQACVNLCRNSTRVSQASVCLEVQIQNLKETQYYIENHDNKENVGDGTLTQSEDYSPESRRKEDFQPLWIKVVNDKVNILLGEGVRNKLINSGQIGTELEDLNINHQLHVSLELVELLRHLEPELITKYRSNYHFTKQLVKLVFQFLETGLKTLKASQQAIRDETILKSSIHLIVTVHHILDCIENDSNLKVWWVESKQNENVDFALLKDNQFLIRQNQFDIEQKMIKVSGRMKREIQMYHKVAHKVFVIKSQRELFFIHKIEKIREKVKLLKEKEKK